MRPRKQNRYRLLPGGLAEVELTHGLSTLVDAAQLRRLLAYKWSARCGKSGHVYAVANVRLGRRRRAGDGPMLYLHRVLLPHDQPHTDHRNGDTLDNRLANLRPATCSQNVAAQTKPREHKTSQYRGVSYNGRYREPWWVSIMKDGILYRRRFATEAEAAVWYDQKARALFGEFAAVNFPASATLQ